MYDSKYIMYESNTMEYSTIQRNIPRHNEIFHDMNEIFHNHTNSNKPMFFGEEYLYTRSVSSGHAAITRQASPTRTVHAQCDSNPNTVP